MSGSKSEKRSNAIVRFAVNRRVTMGMIVLGVLVLGWLSLQRLPLEFLPSFSSSSISVEAPYPSSSPEEVRRLIVQPLEDSLGSINGIDTMSASASSDSGRVSLTFLDGMDMELAAVDVRDRVDRVRHLLPDDVEQIRIRRFQSTDIPIMRFHVSAAVPRERLFEFAEDVLQRRLERLEGVAQVSIDGLQTPKVQIDIDPDRMAAHSIDLRQLVTRLRADNQNMSAGDVKVGSRKLFLRAMGEFDTLEAIRRVPLNDSGVRLADIASVEYTFPRQEEFNFLNGIEALTVSINKVSTANLLEVVDRVKTELDDIVTTSNVAGLTARIYHDASTDVREGLGQLRNAGIFGAGLAILAVYLFLRRFRTTALIAVAMPISVVGTFVLMYFMRVAGVSDITLNVVSLAGLMLALGMLVDNSVVVIESVYRHRNELREDARTAALNGTSEVALPIIASTVTTLCVFLPLVFLTKGGRMQIYLESIATTVAIVIATSLLVALTVVPLAAAYLLEGQAPKPSPFIDALSSGYSYLLRFTLRHRFVFVILIIAMLYGSVRLFGTIERAFSSRSEERQITVHVDTPRQYTVDQTAALYNEVYDLLDGNRKQLDIADISHSYSRTGGRSRGGWRRSRRFEIFLTDEQESTMTTYEAREKLRGMLPTHAGVDLRIAQGRGHGSSSGIEVELSGDDLVVLELLSQKLVERLQYLPMVRDVDTSLESGDEEIHVRVQRERTLQAGISTQAVASTVSSTLSSRAISYFKTGDREVDLIVQYREEDRETLDQLKNVPLRASGAAVPLGALADFEMVAGPRSITREDRRSKISITANTTSPRAAFAAMQMIGQTMASFAMPPGYEWGYGRWSRISQQDQETGTFAIVMALVLVYLLMAALFESFAQPFTIMFSVPFALLGVGVVMKLFEQPLEMTTNIGLIILLGVVVNNAIVLIDHINYLRQHGLTRDEAIIKGGQHRLRPILITAVTTILGLSPLVAPLMFPAWFGPLEGRAATWAPIGLVIMGGLTTSTFLTLMIIPTIYSLIDDAAAFFRRVTRAI